MRLGKRLALSIACAASLTACGGLVGGSDDTAAAGNVVGGDAETGYPAVGYLVAKEGSMPHCSATLIGPSAALTAAHCISAWDEGVLRMGFGAVGSSATFAVKRIFVHPHYHESASYFTLNEGDTDWVSGDPGWHDLAVLILDGPPPVKPAHHGTAAVGDVVRTIGYGISASATSDVSGARKSALGKIIAIDEADLTIEGIDGSGCRGDSGTGIFNPETGSIIGAHSRTKEGAEYGCGAGQIKVATATRTEEAFLVAAFACQNPLRVDCGGARDTRCAFDCADYGASPGERRLDWLCDANACLRKVPPAATAVANPDMGNE